MEIKRPEPKQKMSPSAKLVFKGEIFDVYQWEQELFDGTKKIFERLKRADATVIVPVTSEGKVIMTLQEQPGREPFIGCAGGRIEEGEDPLSSAKRELLEETGYASDDIVLWRATQPAGKIDWVIYTFVARNCRKVAEQSLDGGEKIELKEVDFDEFVETCLQEPTFREVEIRAELLNAKFDPKKMAEVKELFQISKETRS